MEGKELQIIDERELLGKHFVMYGTKEEPLFKAKDVAEWIGYSTANANVMIKNVDEDEKVLHTESMKGNYIMDVWYLTEDGLYEVLMQSQKPIAKKFKKEVKKILKQIRQTGGYIPIVPEETNEQLMARAFIVAQNTIAERDRQLAAIQEENRKQQELLAVQAPKVAYCDLVLTAENTFSASEVAAQLGIRSATALNKFLVSVEFIKAVYKKQFDKKTGKYKKVIAHYLLRADYVDKGLGDVVNVTSKSKDGSKTYSNLQLRYTTKGVKFIYDLIKEKAPELLGNKNNREAD